MANLQNILGSMLATGMGGRSARGPVFASAARTPSGSRGGFGQMAGMASLGYLAYKAWQQHQGQNPAQAPGERMYGEARGARKEGRSLGDRLADHLRQGPVAEEAGMQVSDEKALLLIRAMVAAANADGEISQTERDAILGLVDQAGGSTEEREMLARELKDPPSLEDVVARVRDMETAEQVYLASEMAIVPDGKAEQSYLRYLADRLNLSPERVEELKRIA